MHAGCPLRQPFDGHSCAPPLAPAQRSRCGPLAAKPRGFGAPSGSVVRVRCRARAHVSEIEGLVKAEHVASQDHVIRNIFKKSAKRTPNSFSMRPEGRSQSAHQAVCSRTAEHTRSFLPTVMSYQRSSWGSGWKGRSSVFGGARPNRLGSGRKSLFGPHRDGEWGALCALFEGVSYNMTLRGDMLRLH